ncbi:DUF805 domain-containing protein [Pseudoclavibacter helvolus]|uniref:DUF805 domain-containing protein n=1 Tax=Pseudoclavibacter helvolus TaxID=255205 RepID=UPI00373518F9
MTFFESIRTVFRKYADFTGTASRSEFWWWMLFDALVLTALGFINPTTVGDDGTISGGVLGSVWEVATLLPTLAVLVRRLRDTGRRWTNVFWLLVPVAGLIIITLYAIAPGRPSGAEALSENADAATPPELS